MSLIIKLLGKKLGFKMIDTWVKKMWALDGEVKILDLNEDFYFIYFFNISKGPWMIADH